MSVTLEHVTYIYGEGTPTETTALSDINLEIKDGEFIGLIGHTGSGKSTLIQHLDGLIKATSGDVIYNGESIYGEDFSMKELRSHVGLVFQYPEYQLFEADVISDVKFGPKNQGLSDCETEERAKAALKMVGIGEDYYKKSPFELSGGEKRRVAIAGVLAMEPDVLILDEPTAGLDPVGRDEILGRIAAIQKERGITVILVSHSMEDVAKYVGRIVVMNQGSIVYDDEPRRVFSHYRQLEEIGLAAPKVTYIANALKDAGFPIDTDVITVKEAEEAILSVLLADGESET